jgi:hypothetical protein
MVQAKLGQPGRLVGYKIQGLGSVTLQIFYIRSPHHCFKLLQMHVGFDRICTTCDSQIPWWVTPPAL